MPSFIKHLEAIMYVLITPTVAKMNMYIVLLISFSLGVNIFMLYTQISDKHNLFFLFLGYFTRFMSH